MDDKRPFCSSGIFPPSDSILISKSTKGRSPSLNLSTLRSGFGDVIPLSGPTEQPDPAASHQDSEMSQGAEAHSPGVKEETLQCCLS